VRAAEGGVSSDQGKGVKSLARGKSRVKRREGGTARFPKKRGLFYLLKGKKGPGAARKAAGCGKKGPTSRLATNPSLLQKKRALMRKGKKKGEFYDGKREGKSFPEGGQKQLYLASLRHHERILTGFGKEVTWAFNGNTGGKKKERKKKNTTL